MTMPSGRGTNGLVVELVVVGPIEVDGATVIDGCVLPSIVVGTASVGSSSPAAAKAMTTISAATTATPAPAPDGYAACHRATDEKPRGYVRVTSASTCA